MKRMEVMGKNKKSTVNQNTNDLTVYKVGAAFALLVLALLALGRILNVYATGSTFDVIYRASQTVWTLCVILCAASVAAYIVLRKKSIRKAVSYTHLDVYKRQRMHNERAYIETEERAIIDYQYARDLSIS